MTMENKIIYPRLWSYRLIGLQKKDMERDIRMIMAERKFSLEDANKKGKDLSLNLSLMISSEAERNSLFNALKNTNSIKMVL